jgi:hypothetical protein
MSRFSAIMMVKHAFQYLVKAYCTSPNCRRHSLLNKCLVPAEIKEALNLLAASYNDYYQEKKR